MLRITFMPVAVLMLALFASGVVAQDIPPKTIHGKVNIQTFCENPSCEGFTWSVDFTWKAAQPPPDGYRLNYAVNGKWQSYKKANTPSKGTIFISPEEHAQTGGYKLNGVYVPSGKYVCFRVKARYKGESDGPWTKLCLDG